MAKGFKPVRLLVLIGLVAFVVCGMAVFFTHRGAHGRTAEERAAYEIGERAGEQASRDAKLPTDAELSMMAQKYFEQQGSSDELRNPSPAGGLPARKELSKSGRVQENASRPVNGSCSVASFAACMIRYGGQERLTIGRR